jgi:hypothetical protein
VPPQAAAAVVTSSERVAMFITPRSTPMKPFGRALSGALGTSTVAIR